MRGLNRGGNEGFTIIELLISMVIGLIVIAAIASVYIANRQTYTTTDALSRLQEQARYASMVVRDSIMHAGYYGLISGPIPINGRAGTTSQLPTAAVQNDCGNRWAITLDNPIEAPDTSGGNPFAGTCFSPTTSWNHETVATADMLTVRRVDPQMVFDTAQDAEDAGQDGAPHLGKPDEDGRLFVRTDIVHGEVFVNDSASTPPAGYDSNNVRNFGLESEVFYVSPDSQEDDGIPALRRMQLDVDTMRSELVMSGIEQFQVQVGEDNDADNVPDIWTNPTNADASRARAIRFWLLVRAPDMERDYTDTNTYTMGDISYTPSGDDRRYRRTLVVQTVSLRNLQE